MISQLQCYRNKNVYGYSVKKVILKIIDFLLLVNSFNLPQKQLSRGVLKERSSENMQQIYLRYGCFPINLLHIFGGPFLKNTSGWLLLLLVWYTTTWKYSNSVRKKSPQKKAPREGSGLGIGLGWFRVWGGRFPGFFFLEPLLIYL